MAIGREIEDIARELIRHQHDHPPVRDRLRAQHDYELDVKSEEEVKALMNPLMHQDEILLQIVNRLDRGDNEMKRLLRRLEGPDNGTGSQSPRPEGAKRPT